MTDEKVKIVAYYGFSVTYPECHARFLPPEPMTFIEKVQCALYEFWSIAVPLFWFALSVTCFRWAFGGFDQ